MAKITIGALAAMSGLKITTIRYYERAGVMPAPVRTAGMQRNYTKDHYRRLIFICRAREFGFSIEEIRRLLLLAESPRSSCAEAQQLAGAHLEKLRQLIAALVKLEAILTGTVAQCSGKSILPCPVLELLKGSQPAQPLPSTPHLWRGGRGTSMASQGLQVRGGEPETRGSEHLIP